MILRYAIIFLSVFCGALNAQVTYTVGSYTGTGSAQSISGIGFQPDAILIKSEAAYQAFLVTEDMPAGEAKPMGESATALETGKVTSIDADGFSVGTDSETNNSGTVYHFICWQEGGDLSIGTYTGNGTGTGNSGISVGFNPEFLIICGDQAEISGACGLAFQSLDYTSSEGIYTHTNTRISSVDYVNATAATTFTVGNGDDSPDDSGVDYYYLAFNENGNHVAQNQYGDATASVDGESITISGTSSFQPDFFITMNNVGPLEAVFRIGSLPETADTTFKFTATAALTNRIQGFNATGIEVGTDWEVNREWQTNNNNYFATSGGTLLPVDLISFNGELIEKKVKLKWETATEINSSHFIILRSEDGNDFYEIGEVTAAGNSTDILRYEWIDENPVPGNNYYRLKQVDYDGQYELFRTIIININNGISMIAVNVFPNPVGDKANLYFETIESGGYQLNIYDQLGNLVYDANVMATEGSNNIEFETMFFRPGIYILKISNENGIVKQVKFYKGN
jgi:hypothetical protein